MRMFRGFMIRFTMKSNLPSRSAGSALSGMDTVRDVLASARNKRNRLRIISSPKQDCTSLRCEWLRFGQIDGAAADHCAQHASRKNFRGRNLGQIAVEDHKVSVVSGQELSLLRFGELRVGRSLCV
jgi:hypothetical protein